MERSLLVLLVASLAVAAAVSLHRPSRALPREETGSMKPACDPQTPCAWSVYNAITKTLELTINNTFCDCAVGKQCVQTEDDMSSSTFVYRCRTDEEAKLINQES